MCGPVAAAVGAVASVAGTAMSYSSQKSAADDQKAYNRKVQQARQEYAAEVEAWQNEAYQADLDYIEDILDYRESEFERYKNWREKVEENVQENYLGKLGASIARMTEETLAAELRNMEYQREGDRQQGMATASAAARGVAGNSVRAMLGEIERQESQAIMQNALSNEATQDQIQREMEGYEAEAESTLLNLPRLSFEPIQMPDEPAPVNPVEPAPPVSTPSALGAGLNMISTGISTYASLSNAFQ